MIALFNNFLFDVALFDENIAAIVGVPIDLSGSTVLISAANDLGGTTLVVDERLDLGGTSISYERDLSGTTIAFGGQ